IDLSAVRSEGYSFQIELTYRALRRGFRIEEVPIVFVDRRAGQSKMSRRIFAEAVMMVPKLRLDAIRGEL
ncbi:MAG: polyprenol monophosphomannose synthase, partial [Myxococcota bacterium]